MKSLGNRNSNLGANSLKILSLNFFYLFIYFLFISLYYFHGSLPITVTLINFWYQNLFFIFFICKQNPLKKLIGFRDIFGEFDRLESTEKFVFLDKKKKKNRLAITNWVPISF